MHVNVGGGGDHVHDRDGDGVPEDENGDEAGVAGNTGNVWEWTTDERQSGATTTATRASRSSTWTAIDPALVTTAFARHTKTPCTQDHYHATRRDHDKRYDNT